MCGGGGCVWRRGVGACVGVAACAWRVRASEAVAWRARLLRKERVVVMWGVCGALGGVCWCVCVRVWREWVCAWV